MHPEPTAASVSCLMGGRSMTAFHLHRCSATRKPEACRRTYRLERCCSTAGTGIAGPGRPTANRDPDRPGQSSAAWIRRALADLAVSALMRPGPVRPAFLCLAAAGGCSRLAQGLCSAQPCSTQMSTQMCCRCCQRQRVQVSKFGSSAGCGMTSDG